MPRAIWIIAIGIFAQGTSELMLAGLLPDISADMEISVPQAGWLISAFALGMLIGAPLLAVLTLPWPRRRALLVFVLIFVLTHVAGALAPTFAVLLAMRFIGAFAYAGFWAVGGSTAMALVDPSRRAQAMGVVAGGLTIATVVGLPAGTWIGDVFGWRTAFWVVAAMSLAAFFAILRTVPPLLPSTPPSVRDELKGLLRPRLWISYLLTATAITALIGTFSYLAAMLTTTAGLAPEWVPAVLFGYGIGAVVAIALGGRAAHRFPNAVLGIGFAALVVASAALAFLAHSATAVVALVVLVGFAGFLTNPALNSRVTSIAPAAPTLAVSGNVSAFNTGITLGPWIGGLAISAGHSYAAVPAIGAGIAGLALVILAIDVALQRHEDRRVSATPVEEVPVERA